MERFADDLFNDREEKELERFNEKREKERMEVERLAMVKEEIRKLQSKRIISCLDKVAQADVDFDVPQYPCYVMRLSTLLEKGEEIAALEHENTHEILLGKVDWTIDKRLAVDKKKRKQFR